MRGHSFQQRWFQRRQLFTKKVPHHIQTWLFDPASLTARLKAKCKAEFRVELLSQSMCKPRLDELSALGMDEGANALVREVRLCCGDTGWVYARTVIPFSTITGAQRVYGNLGTRPLGAMLFADRTMRREEVMVTMLYGDDLPELLGLDAASKVWGRRSVFRVGGKPLLVSEYYLPELLQQ